MHALLISPAIPDTFWSFRHSMKFLPGKATFPPLGLLTIAARLPETWSLKLVDLDVEPLTAAHLEWADLALVSAMQIQAASATEVVHRCREAGVKVCAGGVYYTASHAAGTETFPEVDHLFLGEAEETLPRFLQDLAEGRPQPVYAVGRFPSLTGSPAPMWGLIRHRDYNVMPVQFCRGCPHNCDFCHVIILNGRRPRHKTPAQLLAELTSLYDTGFRGTVMIVDDNIVGHRGKARELFLALGEWQRAHGCPFIFLAQATVDLADHPELLELMSAAGFFRLFLGVETPAAASLAECGKAQNQGRDLVAAIKTIQQYGIEVAGGFILGFDADPPTIFADQEQLIEEAAIPVAMVGLLAAPPGTRLYDRLAAEGRITGQSDGDSTMNLDGFNIVPKMGRGALIAGYRRLVARLYESEPYYQRVLRMLEQLGPNPHFPARLPRLWEVMTVVKIFWGLGLREPDRRIFWRFFLRVLRECPQHFSKALSLSVEGHHFRTLSRRFVERTAGAELT